MTGAAGSTVTLTGTTEVVVQLCGLLESDISRRSISTFTATACGVDSPMMSTMPQTASNFNACAGSADCHSPTTRGSGAHFGRMPHVSVFDDRAHHVWSTFSSAHHEMLAIGFQIVSSVGLLGAFTGSRSSVALYVNHNQSKLVTRICLVFRFLVMKERRATHATADRCR